MARCVEVDPELFFPEIGQQDLAAAAKRVCMACEVRVACLAYAVDRPDLKGIWGGKSERQRLAMRGHPKAA